MTGDPIVRASGLTKLYGETEAVRDLDFEARGGEILGLLGPNGAGKTTTIRMVCGIVPATRGSVSLGGFDLKTEPVQAKNLLAYVPDMPTPFDNLTVWEHLRFTAAVYRISSFEARARQLMEEFDLADKRDAPGGELSRGMKQKLAFCCGYLHDPKAILLDEPLTGLDPKGIRTTMESIRTRARSGAAVIVSSHLLEVVEKLCDRLLILNRGRAILSGTLDEIRAAVPDMQKDATLEQVFFRATEA